VIGPFGFALLNPLPARAQPSPFRSVKLPVAPADVGSALRTSWAMRFSPSSYVDPGGQGLPVLSCHTVASIGVGMRYWMPAVSALPLPIVLMTLPAASPP